MDKKNRKTAIITGASKGIGRAIAIGLAGMNYQTVLIGRNMHDLQHVSDEIRSVAETDAVLYALDITDAEKVKETVSQIAKTLGRIDVLVNNAGIHSGGTLELKKEDFRSMLQTNLTAQFYVLQEVVPVMKRQQAGYIFNVASRSGKVGFA